MKNTITKRRLTAVLMSLAMVMSLFGGISFAPVTAYASSNVISTDTEISEIMDLFSYNGKILKQGVKLSNGTNQTIKYKVNDSETYNDFTSNGWTATDGDYAVYASQNYEDYSWIISFEKCYTISYELNGGTKGKYDNDSDYASFSSSRIPYYFPTPIKENYLFAGWYLDSAFTTEAEENSRISSDTTLYAKWVEAHTWSGEGTEASPYLISTVADLKGLAEDINYDAGYAGKVFKLTKDLDVGEWIPIGSGFYHYFKGTFDGNSKTITYSISNDVGGTFGLFGTSEGIIKNLNVKGQITVSSLPDDGQVPNIGGIIANNCGTITNCYSDVNINMTEAVSDKVYSVGGVVGYNNVMISYCSSTSEITVIDKHPKTSGVYSDVGGITGYNSGETVTNSTFVGTLNVTSDVTINDYDQGGPSVGMICGGHYGGEVNITDCNYASSKAGNLGYLGINHSGEIPAANFAKTDDELKTYAFGLMSTYPVYALGIYKPTSKITKSITGEGIVTVKVDNTEVTDTTEVEVGKTVTLEVAPGTDYQLKDISVSKTLTLDDVITAIGTGTFTAQNRTIKVDNNDLKFISTIGGGGNFTCNGFNPVNNSFTFTNNTSAWITLDDDNYITAFTMYLAGENVKMSGKSENPLQVASIDLAGTGNTRTFTMPAQDVTVNATFVAGYAVTLNPNGGTIADGKDVTFYETGTFTELPKSSDITKEGYTFDGWYRYSNLIGEVADSIASTETGAKTYYAKWTPISYAITLNLDGGVYDGDTSSTSAKPVYYTIETDTFTLKYPVKDGYVFLGWAKVATGGTPVMDVTIEKGSTGDPVYYAYWETKANTQGKVDGVVDTEITGVTSSNFDSVAKVEASDESSSSTYVKEELKVEKTDEADVSTAMADAVDNVFVGVDETTIQKTYLEIDVTKYVTTISDTGTSTDSEPVTDMKKPVELEFNLASLGYTTNLGNLVVIREHEGAYKVFDKLDAKPEANAMVDGTIYVDTTNSKLYVYSQLFSTYAIVNTSATLQTVTLDVNGGNALAKTVYYVASGETLTLPTPTTSQTGYEFDGWYDSAYGGTKVTSSTPINADSTFYAHWEVTIYSISYDLAGGSVGTPNYMSYNVDSPTFTLNNPTRSGYTFLGWTGTGLTSATTTVTIATGSTGNRSYTATWKSNSSGGGTGGGTGGGGGGYSGPTYYTVSFNSNGGSTVSSQSVVSGGKVTKPVNPTKSGYKFDGWYTDSTLKTAFDFETKIYSSITLYAKWTENTTPTPTTAPTVAPTEEPTANPTDEPTAKPTVKPTSSPTANPTEEPTANPTDEPTAKPTVKPTSSPTANPTVSPTATVKPALALNSGFKVSQTGSKITVKWGKVSGATSYEVFVTYCGQNYPTKATMTVKSGTTKVSITKLNGKKLNLKKSFKVYVVAKNGSKKLGKTITAHVAGRKSIKYSNAKSISLKSKSKVSLKVSKTSQIKAEIILADPKKKALTHTKKFRYVSSDTSVAVVSKSGKITAKKKGTCYIYVYANNGCAKKVKVTVK